MREGGGLVGGVIKVSGKMKGGAGLPVGSVGGLVLQKER